MILPVLLIAAVLLVPLRRSRPQPTYAERMVAAALDDLSWRDPHRASAAVAIDMCLIRGGDPWVWL